MKSKVSQPHIPHGPHIPEQSEKGAAAIAKAHGKVTDLGAINRTAPHPQAQSSPLTGNVGLPYSCGDND